MKIGKVWLVGAGPGDVGLLTVKGKRLLEEAEVVVYDALVGQGILSMLPKGIAMIDVGKRAGKHKKSQEEINRILVEEAKKGLRVVRLKGGDPFLFGRGGEEVEALKCANIPFEIVPGVTSSIAVPAYNGIPVTHRDYTSSVHIITGHKKQGESLDIDFASLVKLKGTLVFLMGLSSLFDICEGLLEAGMDREMPAAILQEGCSAGQRSVFTSLSKLVQRAKEENIGMPSIIVVGEVCSLAGEFSWYEKLPLAGKKIILTRPQNMISTMAEKLRKKGAEVIEFSAISLVEIQENKEFDEALSELEKFSWIGFTSPSGVDIFFSKLRKAGLDLRKLAGIKIAVIGQGTKTKLEERGIYADFMPSVYDGYHMGKELATLVNKEDKILFARAKKGNRELIEEIKKSGAKVVDIAIYDTLYEKAKVAYREEDFLNKKIYCVAFTSASTVEGFVKAMPETFDFSTVRAACIGRQTAEAAKKYGMKVRISKEASIDSLIRLIEEMEEV